MRSYLLPALAAVATLSSPAAAALVSLDAGVTGTITINSAQPPFPVPGSTFTMTGGFSSYNQTGLPAINAGDLNAYSFTVTGTSAGFDQSTLTTTYTGVVGTITAYGQLIQEFTSSSLKIKFRDGTGEIGDVFGRLYSTGPQNPAGFPGTVDFSPANGAKFVGVYTRSDAQTGAGSYTGSITAPGVPEPATWGLMILGFGLVGAALRRRRSVAIAA